MSISTLNNLGSIIISTVENLKNKLNTVSVLNYFHLNKLTEVCSILTLKLTGANKGDMLTLG